MSTPRRSRGKKAAGKPGKPRKPGGKPGKSSGGPGERSSRKRSSGSGKAPGTSGKPADRLGKPGGKQAKSSGGSGGQPARKPAETVVAVLEKRGRFWAAEPVFPPPRSDDRGRDPRASRRVTLGSNRVADRGGQDARAGDVVLVGQAGRGDGRAQIARVLGRPDVARDLIEGLLLDRGLARGFDPAVEREARASAARKIQATDGRRDLTGLPTFTIDPTSARDFDDAISAERLGGDPARDRDLACGDDPAYGDDPMRGDDRTSEGPAQSRTRVWVHIADVCTYVPEGSLVDLEARRRGTSVYVPGAVEPMLPEALSNEACSLVPGKERAAVTVELELHGATVVKAAFYRSLIRSDARLSYEQVDEIFAAGDRGRESWAEPLAAARAAAGALEEDRRKGHSGALTLDSSEPEFVFDDDGHVEEVLVRVQTESHRLIEHLMIAANEAVARLLSERDTPCLYRVHERPEPERVRRLVEQLATLDVPTPPVPKNMSPSQAAELMGEISRRIEAHVSRAGGRAALTSLLLRTLQQAAYSPKNSGHAGLGTAYYCHFTSPIRRYPDLVCHRALLSAVGAIGAGERAPRAAGMGELAEWTSDRERAAMTIERDADDVACCFALERVLYEQGFEQTFVGEVVGLIAAGAFVSFGARASVEGAAAADGALPVYRGMLPVRLMRGAGGEREWWELNEQGTILHGESPGSTLRLGDRVEVRVARVDVARGRVDLVPAG